MKRPLLIFITVLAAYALTAGGHLYTNMQDDEVLFRTTEALATRGSLAIEPVIGGFGTRTGVDKKEYAQYGIGQPLLAVPFYWAGAALSHIGSDAFWSRITPGAPQTAAEAAPRHAVSWFNIILGAFMAALLYLVCLELTGHAAASAWAAMLYALGSMAWPHSRPFFTEACAAFFILLAWYALLRAERGRMMGWCALAGAAAGYAALVRADSVLAYPALALLLCGPIVAAARRQGRSFIAAWAAFGIPALVCGAVLLGLNWMHFGGAGESAYKDQPEGIAFTTPLAAGLYGFLFSAGKGLFFFSPGLILSFWGWRHLARRGAERHPALIWAVALAIIIPLAVHAKWQNWPGGWCWGPRHVFIIHPFLALPVAAWCAAASGAAGRVIATGFLLTGMAVQLMGASQDFILYHQRFFRTPGAAFLVQFDDFDRRYWEQYYQLLFRMEPDQQPHPVSLCTPRPVQDSLYIPQASVWEGYPRLLREGQLDNFWVRLYQATSMERRGGAR